MKRYIKPVSEVIQTEATCNSFVQATVMRDMGGSDQPTVVGTIPVFEDRDPNNRPNSSSDAWSNDNLSEGGLWGGD